MDYHRICRDLGQGAAEIQARLLALALLDARSGAASRAGRHWLSDPDSPFGPRPNYETLSSHVTPWRAGLALFLLH